jgi:hypothetical protein
MRRVQIWQCAFLPPVRRWDAGKHSMGAGIVGFPVSGM